MTLIVFAEKIAYPDRSARRKAISTEQGHACVGHTKVRYYNLREADRSYVNVKLYEAFRYAVI